MVGLATRTVGQGTPKCKCYTKELDFLGSARDPLEASVIVELDSAAPESATCEVLAVPFTGSPSATFLRLDERLGGRLAKLLASGEAKTEAGKTVLLHVA